MDLVVVFFRAYDKPCEKVFLNKSFFQIHTELHEICETYVPTCILHATKPQNRQLALLENFKATEPTKQKQHESNQSRV